jgi:hypothetical protein
MTAGNHDEDRSTIHPGPAHSSPYPVSRLAPAFGLVDLAREIEQADQMVSARVEAQLRVIADQVKSLQAQARDILQQAKHDQRLHHARCAFQRIPGHIYHLYREVDGTTAFSMLSPEDWNGRPPKPFLGSYRLENDMSWTPAGTAEQPDDSRQLVARLLESTGREG